MKTTKFKDVLITLARKCGLDPDTNDLSPAEAATLCEFLNERAEEVAGFAWWPELTLTEERFYRADWAAATTYAIGDEVYYADTDAYYVALLAGTNKQPDTETTYWEEADELDRYVPWQLDGTTMIAEVRACYKNNPRTSVDNPYPLAFELSENGVQMSTLAGTSVFLLFRSTPPRFTTTAYSAATNYDIDDLVYLESSKQCYRCFQAGIGQSPATETTYWEEILFPAIWRASVIQGAYADWLEEDGQQEKALVAEAKFAKLLADAADKYGPNERAKVNLP
jgi:hypothetical protein